jgi:excisionase family DNA binding protein
VGLMTVKDLAERWGLAESKVKKLVREKSIPFVSLGKGGDMRLNWDRVRFRLEAIEQWEQEHQTVFKNPEQPLALPTRSLLGDWSKQTASRD